MAGLKVPIPLVVWHIYTSLCLSLPLSVALHGHISIAQLEGLKPFLSPCLSGLFSSPYLLITSTSNTLTLYPIQTSLDGSSPMSPFNSVQEIPALRTSRLATFLIFSAR